MGDKLMRRVALHVWPSETYAGLSLAARVVLMRMAQSAMDADDQPTYFAGWEPLAWCLGHTPLPTARASRNTTEAPDDPDQDPLHDTARRARDSAERAVGRAVRELRRAGLVAQDPNYPRHHKRRWHLLIPGLPAASVPDDSQLPPPRARPRAPPRREYTATRLVPETHFKEQSS